MNEPKRAEQNLLQQAIQGDLASAAQVLAYITSSLADLRRLMEHAIHQTNDNVLWRHLLVYLACEQWGDWEPLGNVLHLRPLDWHEPQSGAAAQAIRQLFITDLEPGEGQRKTLILKRALQAPKPVPYAAAWLLGLRGQSEALPVLEEMLTGGGDPSRAADEVWQLRAVEALGVLGDRRGANALLVALTSSRGAVHRLASRAIRQLGNQAEEALQMALFHPDSHIRWHAARALGEIGDLRGIQTLVAGLADEHPAVRWATASTLANLGVAALPYILRFLSEQPLNEPIRQAVLHALNAMNDPQARQRIEPLINALRSPHAAVQVASVAQRLLLEPPEHQED